MGESVSAINRQGWRSRFVIALLTVVLKVGAVEAADDLYRILGQNQQQESVVLGSLKLVDSANGKSYRIEWNEGQFENYFLSMRPFKCLPHPVQLICHLPYPYEIQRRISEDDLTDLEYDLLFLHKTPQEYGINAWNGLYFKFQRSKNGFIGELRETDLNVLQAPPEEGELRPIDPDALYEPSDKHWLRRIIIDKVRS
ncbi:MAG: hypothetical protein B6D78_02655 [gamma proteobacterium symbiont of Ctena orbiculata]|nr:MAG: hypothetical protein B6D78_02655 [gamma proteobacterium symbiont of Ctena orbiculata]